MVNSLLVEISAEMLPVAVDKFDSGQRTVTTGVKICEDLLQLDSVVHVQEVLDQVAQCSLLSGIFG